MARKPRLLTVIADGGRKKGGACYGSFSVSGFPGEEPHTLTREPLEGPDTSTEAEAAILKWAVQEAATYAKALKLNKKHWGLLVISDSQTLITKLTNQSSNGIHDFVGICVQEIWDLAADFKCVQYKWVPRAQTKATFGH